MNRVEESLGKYHRVISDDYSIMIKANEGISSMIFDDILEMSGIPKSVLAEQIFDMSVKTMFRYKRDNKTLSPRLSETALKVVNLLHKGLEVFGEIQSFRNWLNKPAYGLGDRVPLKLLNTNTGIDLIGEELLRIEHGVLA